MNLVKTGIGGLDAILKGGFRPLSSVLIQGGPGAGKTILGLQCVVNGAMLFDEAAVIVTFDPFIEDLLRDALGFGWDLRELQQRKKIKVIRLEPDALHSSFAERQSEAVNAITNAAAETNARRILVDGILYFRQYHPSGRAQRDVLSGFVGVLKSLNLTSFLTCELMDLSPQAVCEEEFTCDSVVRLHHFPRPRFGGRRRMLEMIKSRGQDFLDGLHPFWFSPEGIRVLPIDSAQFLDLLRDLNAAVAAMRGRDEESDHLRRAAHGLTEEVAHYLGMGASDLEAWTAPPGEQETT